MAHIRYFEANALVEVTVTTLDNRYLLRPSARLNRTILGILGRAQRIHGMAIVDFKFMSSHAHLLLRPRDAGQLGEFMCFVNTNLSKELGKIHKIRGPKLQRPFHLMEISDEERAQIARLRYPLPDLELGEGALGGSSREVARRPGSDGGLSSGRRLVFADEAVRCQSAQRRGRRRGLRRGRDGRPVAVALLGSLGARGGRATDPGNRRGRRRRGRAGPSCRRASRSKAKRRSWRWIRSTVRLG